MKLLVTGGAGFIGSNFIRYVLSLDKGYEIVNFDKLTYAGNLANLGEVAESPSYSLIKGDICDATAVEAAMRGCEAVVHFAAESHVDRSIYEPAQVIETNITGTFVLLQVARTLRLGRFVHISTDEVYGDMPESAFADEAITTPPEQSLLGIKGLFRPAGPVVCPHLRVPGRHHALVEQLRPVPVSREVSASNDHQRTGGQAPADLWRRQTTARLAACRR